MHRNERPIESDEKEPEVDLAKGLVQQSAGHLREPVVHAGKDRHQASADEYVMNVADDEVRAVNVQVERNGGEKDAGDAADRKQPDETDRKQHRRREVNFAAP